MQYNTCTTYVLFNSFEQNLYVMKLLVNVNSEFSTYSHFNIRSNMEYR